MNKLNWLIIACAVFFVLSCKDDKEMSGPYYMTSTGKMITAQEMAADTTGLLFSEVFDSALTVSDIEAIKIPYEEIDSVTAKQWIRDYDSLKTPIGHDSLVKRIWLRDDILNKVVWKASTAKFFIALVPTPAGDPRKLTVLLQLNVKRSDHFKYYDLSDPTSTMAFFSVDGSFCPPPYPCSSDSIWAFKTAD